MGSHLQLFRLLKSPINKLKIPKFRMMISVCLFLLAFSCLSFADDVNARERKPKLFFVSTSSTTSTMSTTTLCYKTNAAAACTSGRKRRAINFMDKQENDEEAMDLNPAPVDKKDIESYYDAEEDDLESSQASPSELRDPRFLLYWMTTTSTSTSTTYTATTTLGTLECTPSSFTLNACG